MAGQVEVYLLAAELERVAFVENKKALVMIVL